MQVNEITEVIIGAAIEVHRVLGPGFLEAVYEEALCVELDGRRMPFLRQVPIAVAYKGHPVGEARLDLLVAQTVVVELKAVGSLSQIHTAQIMSYLKATGHPLGLLINFNVPYLRDGLKRIILSRNNS